MPILDIIVPHYDETWQVGKKLFDSIEIQRGVNFSDIRVILVEDGKDHDIYPMIEEQDYPYEVVPLSIPHSGVSAARNRGLDYSQARWVMFCDYDDLFASIYSLKSILEVLGTEDFDLLWYPIYVELGPGCARTLNDQYNRLFVHGKVYRREFLKEHNLRFNESLFYSEDTAFNYIVDMELSPNRRGEIRGDPVRYTWTWRYESATTNPNRAWTNSVGLFRRQAYITEEFAKRNRNIEASAMAARAMCDAFVAITTVESDEKVNVFLPEVKEFYAAWQDPISGVDDKTIKTAYNGALKEARISPESFPNMGQFEDWMDSLTSWKDNRCGGNSNGDA